VAQTFLPAAPTFPSAQGGTGGLACRFPEWLSMLPIFIFMDGRNAGQGIGFVRPKSIPFVAQHYYASPWMHKFHLSQENAGFLHNLA
jgi:hypothetical protein